LLIQGWCCSTEANSVEAIAARSFNTTWLDGLDLAHAEKDAPLDSARD